MNEKPSEQPESHTDTSENPPYQQVIDWPLLDVVLKNLPDNATHIDLEHGLNFQMYLETALSEKLRGIRNLGLAPKHNMSELFPAPPELAEEYLHQEIKRMTSADDKVDGISMLFPPIPRSLDRKDITSILPSFIKDGGILTLGKPFFTTPNSKLDSNAWDEWRKRALTNLGVSHKESTPSETSDPLKEDKKFLEESGFHTFSENWQTIKYSYEELVSMSKDPFFIKEFFNVGSVDPNELPKITNALIATLKEKESLEIGYHKIIARKLISKKPSTEAAAS